MTAQLPPGWARMPLSGWGRLAAVPCMVARPERAGQWSQALEHAPADTVIVRGAGRSYGDAAVNALGATVLSTRMDRYVSFDPDTAWLTAECGVTVADVLRTFLPRGYMLPVVPGTGFATLGGALAMDVHGKNQHRRGSFAHHVRWFDLRLAHGESLRVDRQNAPELFAATAGGLGLTGAIERLCVQLMPVPSNAADVFERRIPDLDAFLDALDAARDRSEYLVGWVDALASGASLGRGILEEANPAAASLPERPPRRLSVPVDLPAIALNRAVVRTFNATYLRRVPAQGRQGRRHWVDFLFPLDAIHDWNRMYGRRGFRQFQCLVPAEQGRVTLRAMLERISRDASPSFLAVLKAMEPQGEGLLSFSGPGYTLALDFPESAKTLALLQDLDRMTQDAGGRTYLAKDSTLTPERFRSMYPRWRDYLAICQQADPGGRWSSDMARRLSLQAAQPGPEPEPAAAMNEDGVA